MAWANIEDVEKILPEDEDPIPTAGHARDRLAEYLEEATDVVGAFLGREYDGEDEDSDGVPDDVPLPVRRVVARVALRGFVDPPPTGVQSETNAMGPFSYHVNWAREAMAGDFYLTDTDEMRLKKFRLGGARGAGHTPMAGACAWWA